MEPQLLASVAKKSRSPGSSRTSARRASRATAAAPCGAARSQPTRTRPGPAPSSRTRPAPRRLSRAATLREGVPDRAERCPCRGPGRDADLGEKGVACLQALEVQRGLLGGERTSVACAQLGERLSSGHVLALTAAGRRRTAARCGGGEDPLRAARRRQRPGPTRLRHRRGVGDARSGSGAPRASMYASRAHSPASRCASASCVRRVPVAGYGPRVRRGRRPASCRARTAPRRAVPARRPAAARRRAAPTADRRPAPAPAPGGLPPRGEAPALAVRHWHLRRYPESKPQRDDDEVSPDGHYLNTFAIVSTWQGSGSIQPRAGAVLIEHVRTLAMYESGFGQRGWYGRARRSLCAELRRAGPPVDRGARCRSLACGWFGDRAAAGAARC